ncbi:hypothetical protein A2291_06820 [candidate division WOR-1 bacterium RIFOXYB2_FULL_42_35]|uniref:Radical SAM core domain-containing protein n=1 Tax=candidate division WOR-1 bacterium RIFOXYC2_FULL_41_25 TaxID=1802586 RepID=A0A1F4TPT2_UNCSA|nr:MAG: hypothetical protein A2291_06820 [candidate division WOR-1 bacterium RIFOXYB2_FULL_42_35]OGC24591.1 MAG: hypothetical protein A2247_06600 [candidate division WOR-1 bacterium RIFOXYA2_FULL_41_14]OGC34637.1 MAG: hypothetical protein A2462_04835 [candidate division WOR-1 bacterium RIFOXYC2_FULL_41_25]OGC43306.1 MAG: hypothetical protein A2548_07580 [candidate division WOR-1 bacterium RIFOXYD2_FULL_41_8]
MWRDGESSTVASGTVVLGKEVFRQLKKEGVTRVNITGGEPLLREDIPELLQQAAHYSLRITLFTNGILYADKANSLNGLIDKLFFSLDYPFAEMHDRSRGVECFHTVIKAIKLAQELGQKPIINFTLTRDSVLYLPEMVDLAERLKVFVYLNPVYDFSGTQGFETATLNHIRYYLRRKLVLINLAILEFIKAGGNKVITPRCRATETTITVLPDGKRVGPCFFNQGGRRGREDICSSCLRWPYIVPSFSRGFDKYFWLNLVSDKINKFKAR